MIYLPRSVGALVLCCATEAQRYSMTGVRVFEYDGHLWRCEATDGRRAVVLRGTSEPHPLDLSAVSMLGGGDQEGEPVYECVVPATSVAAAVKAVKLTPKVYGSQPERTIGVRMTANGVVLVAGDATIRTPPVEGRFPDVGAIMPKGNALASVRLNPHYLIDLCRVAIEVSRGGDLPECVHLHFFGEDRHGPRPLGLTAQGKGGRMDALIMPVT